MCTNHRHAHAHTHFTLSKSFTHSFTHTHTHTHTQGPCPPCQGERNVTCPCSRKATVAVPCGARSQAATEEGGGRRGREEISEDSAAEGTCGGVCGKLLHCREHYCTRRCHFGTCGPCRVQVCWLLCVCQCVYVNRWTVESIAVRVGVRVGVRVSVRVGVRVGVPLWSMRGLPNSGMLATSTTSARARECVCE